MRRTAALRRGAAWTGRVAAWSLLALSWAAGDAAAKESEGLVLYAAKVLSLASDGPAVVDRGAVVVRDGRIEWVGPRDELELPVGYRVRDLGDNWLMPGMIDLHSHIGGSFDINESVYQASPELNARASAIPDNRAMRVALASGVTTILFIPGSATTVGGQGILIKTGVPRYEDALVRDPGSLKVAQADNPVRWGYGMGRIMLNWTIDEISRRGVAYAKRHEAFERGEGPEPAFNAQLEIYRHLLRNEAQISTHTQVAQVVLSSIRILKVQNGLPTYIDHGTFDAFKIAHVAEREGVAAILGPRNMSAQLRGRGVEHDGRFEGVAAGYQRAGHTQIGFNTDAPVIPAEELFLQASIAARFGFDDRSLDTVRGLTSVPARTAGIDHRMGSLEPGKDADLVAITGHPADPRNHVLAVWIEGNLVYDVDQHGRRF